MRCTPMAPAMFCITCRQGIIGQCPCWFTAISKETN